MTQHLIYLELHLRIQHWAQEMASQESAPPVLPVAEGRPLSRSRSPLRGPSRVRAASAPSATDTVLVHELTKISKCRRCNSSRKVITFCQAGRQCCSQEHCGNCGKILRRTQGQLEQALRELEFLHPVQ